MAFRVLGLRHSCCTHGNVDTWINLLAAGADALLHTRKATHPATPSHCAELASLLCHRNPSGTFKLSFATPISSHLPFGLHTFLDSTFQPLFLLTFPRNHSPPSFFSQLVVALVVVFLARLHAVSPRRFRRLSHLPAQPLVLRQASVTFYSFFSFLSPASEVKPVSLHSGNTNLILSQPMAC